MHKGDNGRQIPTLKSTSRVENLAALRGLSKLVAPIITRGARLVPVLAISNIAVRATRH